MKGIIYRAYNKISGKSYIGQTINTLEVRRSAHFRTAKNCKKKLCHFQNALNKYNKEDWDWSIIEDNIDQHDLNEKEMYYIKLYDTYPNGYNGNYGGTNVKVAKKHNFYHKDYGVITATNRELSTISNITQPNITLLINKKIDVVKGWILAENISKYDDIVNPASLIINGILYKGSSYNDIIKNKANITHHQFLNLRKYGDIEGRKYKGKIYSVFDIYGVKHEGMLLELSKKFGLSRERIRQIAVSKTPYVKPIRLIELMNSVTGEIIRKTIEELRTEYNISYTVILDLKKGKRLHYKRWRFVSDTNDLGITLSKN